MKSIFLSPEQVFDKHLEVLETVGPAAPASEEAVGKSCQRPRDGCATLHLATSFPLCRLREGPPEAKREGLT